MSPPKAHLVHATCIALDGHDANGGIGGVGNASGFGNGGGNGGGEGWRGILLRGASGAGKSDLALRLIDQGALLVADDQCALVRQGGHLIARAPAAIAGALEVRGLGLRDVPSLADVPLALIVDLVPADAQDLLDRLPDAATEEILGVTVPYLALDPFAASAPAKLRMALRGTEADLPRDGTPRPDSNGAPAAPSGPSPNSGIHPESDGRQQVAVVTGLSGAGHSSALKILEDLGYESVDNLPLSLLDALLGEGGPVAVGVDIRTRNFAARPLLERLDQLRADPDRAVTLLFLDCADEILERRFTETRRRHPLAQDRRVVDGIAAERQLVAPLRACADLVVDTSDLSATELRRFLSGHFALARTPAMSVFVTSFSYRHGLPREADLVFDVRFLANPHYQLELRALDGRDPRVDAFVAADTAFEPFFARLTAMLEPLLPRYEQEGKSYLTIAIGCTGGRHRSVAVAERLAAWLARGGREVHKSHRDVARGAGHGARQS
jgi:RNase adaptor protein for sRNA GlmZ degradation